MTHKILLVDDEPFITEEAAEALTEEGYECITADNVDAAIEVLDNHPDIAVVITDMKMPGKGGNELIREVREGHLPEMKFIIMSGHGSTTVETDGIDIDPPRILRKPIDIFDLIECVRMVLRDNALGELRGIG